MSIIREFFLHPITSRLDKIIMNQATLATSLAGIKTSIDAIAVGLPVALATAGEVKPDVVAAVTALEASVTALAAALPVPAPVV